MSLPWFRMYAEFATDPVVQALAFEDQRHFTMLLCLKCSGLLDRQFAGDQIRTDVIRKALGLDGRAWDEARSRLIAIGLVDERMQPVNWDKRQYTSDSSSSRVKAFRERQRNVSVTPPDTDTEDKNSSTPVSKSNLSSTAADESAARAAPIPSNWQPNAANREWMVKAGLTPAEQAKIVNEFVRWARNAELRKSEKNWQLAFSRNPTVKGAVGRGKSAHVDQGDRERRDVAELAKLLKLTQQPAESDAMFAGRVKAANQRRIDALGKGA